MSSLAGFARSSNSYECTGSVDRCRLAARLGPRRRTWRLVTILVARALALVIAAGFAHFGCGWSRLRRILRYCLCYEWSRDWGCRRGPDRTHFLAMMQAAAGSGSDACAARGQVGVCAPGSIPKPIDGCGVSRRSTPLPQHGRRDLCRWCDAPVPLVFCPRQLPGRVLIQHPSGTPRRSTGRSSLLWYWHGSRETCAAPLLCPECSGLGIVADVPVSHVVPAREVPC